MTASELAALWSARDNRYRARREAGFTAQISEEEEEAIIAFRRREIDRLIPDSWERIRALAILADWTAPRAT